MISPGDVWLTFREKGQLDRSVYLDLDVLNWPASLPDDLLESDYSAANIIVNDGRQIGYLRLRERGYAQVWASDRYSIWSRPADR